MMARVYLARLCGALIHAPELYGEAPVNSTYRCCEMTPPVLSLKRGLGFGVLAGCCGGESQPSVFCLGRTLCCGVLSPLQLNCWSVSTPFDSILHPSCPPEHPASSISPVPLSAVPLVCRTSPSEPRPSCAVPHVCPAWATPSPRVLRPVRPVEGTLHSVRVFQLFSGMPISALLHPFYALLPPARSAPSLQSAPTSVVSTPPLFSSCCTTRPPRWHLRRSLASWGDSPLMRQSER